MNKAIRRYLRGAEYFLRYAFVECPRGLDFSIRNKAAGITLAGNHGYALTSKKALRNMLRRRSRVSGERRSDIADLLSTFRRMLRRLTRRIHCAGFHVTCRCWLT